jgi:hypothetical protein
MRDHFSSELNIRFVEVWAIGSVVIRIETSPDHTGSHIIVKGNSLELVGMLLMFDRQLKLFVYNIIERSSFVSHEGTVIVVHLLCPNLL